jgi:hypothetical protein
MDAQPTQPADANAVLTPDEEKAKADEKLTREIMNRVTPLLLEQIQRLISEALACRCCS